MRSKYFSIVFSVVFCLTLVFTSFVFSFADVSFSPLPVLSDVSYNSLSSSGLSLPYNDSGRISYIGVNPNASLYFSKSGSYYTFSLSDTPIYAFVYPSGNYYYVCTACDFPDDYIDFSLSSPPNNLCPVISSSNVNNSLYYSSFVEYSSSYDLTFSSNIGQILPSLFNNELPFFNSRDEGFASVRDYIDNGGGSSSSSATLSNYSLPAGNVIYIKTANSSDEISLTTSFEQWSAFGQNTWTNITQTITRNVSLPSEGTTFPLSGGFTIDWIKDRSNTNILGQSKDGYYTFTSGDGWTAIYNPLYQQYGQGNNHDLNGTIYVSCDSVVDYYTYPLSGSIVTGVGIQSGSVGNYEEYTTTAKDENGNPIVNEDGTFQGQVNQSGSSAAPVTGGEQSGSIGANMTVTDYLKSLGNTLTSFANNLLSLIQVPISHIGQLIEGGSGFMGALRGLYAWLPVDIQSYVISALTVVIGVAVFKVFL